MTTLAAGQLVVTPAGNSLIEESVTQHVEPPIATTITVWPTAVGLARLKHAPRRAQLRGNNLAEVEARARFSFTSYSGTPSSLTRRYTLELK